MRYIYFGKNKGGNHQGITCVGYEIEGERKMKMSFSFCNPGDRFSRKKAHAILEGRMNNDQTVTSNTGGRFLKYEEVTDIARELLNLGPGEAPNIKDFSNATKHKEHLAVGGVNLPWWFKGV